MAGPTFPACPALPRPRLSGVHPRGQAVDSSIPATGQAAAQPTSTLETMRLLSVLLFLLPSLVFILSCSTQGQEETKDECDQPYAANTGQVERTGAGCFNTFGIEGLDAAPPPPQHSTAAKNRHPGALPPPWLCAPGQMTSLFCTLVHHL